MSRRLIFIALLGVFLGLDAQEHSVFLGQPLGGDKDEFVEGLEDKGYAFEQEQDGCTTLSGLFDGVGALIEVHSTPRSHLVHLVTVYFVEIGGNEIGLLMKTRQVRKQLRRKYASWDYTRQDGTEEWSSPYARISFGKKRLNRDDHKTLFVQWQDRSGWEALQRETK